MSQDETKKIANELLLEKYEPILVIKLSHVPPVKQLQSFAERIQEQFGYLTLVLPGDLETSVDIISVCKSEIVEIDTLKEKVYSCIRSLSEEVNTTYDSKIFKRLGDNG